MKYYSEVLNKTFDTIKDLEAAEKENRAHAVKQAVEEDKRRKAQLDAKEELEKAYKAYRDALNRLSVCETEYFKAKENYKNLMKEPGDDMCLNRDPFEAFFKMFW